MAFVTILPEASSVTFRNNLLNPTNGFLSEYKTIVIPFPDCVPRLIRLSSGGGGVTGFSDLEHETIVRATKIIAANIVNLFILWLKLKKMNRTFHVL
jgi:hypothetical protein